MAVTNLTGYTWVGNDWPWTTNFVSKNINFTSNGNNYTNFRTTDVYIPDLDERVPAIEYDYNEVYNSNDGWDNSSLKTIDIKGGADAGDLNFITLLEGLGTLTPTPVTGYDVTFVTNGGTSVNPLEEVEELPTPLPTTTKANNIFVGWYYDTLLTQRAYAGDELTSNVTLYARFYANMEEFYNHVANAIRTKRSTTGLIKHTEFADEILKI